MSITFNNCSFQFAASEPMLFDRIDLTLAAPRTGIVGSNGSGKSTLLKCITAELQPTAGTIRVSGMVARLPQDLLQLDDRTVASVLGVEPVIAALDRIAAGSVDPADYDEVGNDWDIRARAEAIIARRIPSLSLDGVLERPTATCSGGELVQLGLAALELSGATIALLDEPTNNLDARARAALQESLASWPGQVVVVSHDTELLNTMDEIVELHDGTATVYGGNYDLYVAERQAAQDAALRAERDAKADVRRQERERQQVETALARRANRGARLAANKRASGMAMGNWKNNAERTRGSERNQAADKVQSAKARLAAASDAVRDDDSIRIPIITPLSTTNRHLLDLVGTNQTLSIRTGERWALIGDNGVGKSTMLQHSLANAASTRAGVLDQRLALPEGTVFEVVRTAAPDRPPNDTHALLAKFLFRGDTVNRPVSLCSGGERFRVALARILLADPPPELLVLDEPSNNLDAQSVAQLVSALASYRGALLIVSHDRALLEQLDLDRTVELCADGSLW